MTHWPRVMLGDVAKVTSGDGAPQEESAFSESGTPFVRAGSLARLVGGDSEDELELIPDEEAHRRKMTKYPPGTVVFAKSGMSCTKGLVHQLQKPAFVVNHLAALQCTDDILPRFLLRWFEAHSPARLIANPAYPSIKISTIRSEVVPLPRLDEQKRIAAILDAADGLRAKRRSSLALLDDLLQATFLDMFGDPVTNPMGWEICKLGEVTVIGSGAGFPNKHQGRETGQYPFYKVSDMNLPGNERYLRSCNNFIDEDVRASLGAKVHPASTVVFPKIGAAIATNKKRILTSPSCFDNNVIGIHPSGSFTVEWLFGLIQTKQLMDFANPGNPPSIRKTVVEDWKIPLAPLNLQQHFADIVESVEQQKTRYQSHLDELDTLFASLQSRAFKGEL